MAGVGLTSMFLHHKENK